MSDTQPPLAAELVPPWSVLESLPGPVWGIDPSTKRISVARLGHAEPIAVGTLSLEQPAGHRGARLARARPRLVEWFEELGAWAPHTVALEEPFGAMWKGRQQVPVVGLEVQGMLLCALWEAFGAGPVVELVSPTSWKKAAVGHGFAKPAAYRAWGEGVLGRGLLEDEAAALGVATWAALEVTRRAPTSMLTD